MPAGSTALHVAEPLHHAAAVRALLFDRTDPVGRPVPGDWYAILDGGAVDATDHLPTRLAALAPGAHACLYAGALAPDLAAVAPYLVALPPDDAVTRWVLDAGWGRPWGVFVRTLAPFDVLRRHLRRFLVVHDEPPPGGVPRRLLFRYYDPRVLVPYVESCTVAERRAFFGPVLEFAAQAYPVCNRPAATLVRLARSLTDALLRYDAPLGATPRDASA